MFESIAYAADVAVEGAPKVNPLVQFMPMILIFVIFYFLMIRPQQKKQKELQAMITGIKKGTKLSPMAVFSGPFRAFRMIMWSLRPETRIPKWKSLKARSPDCANNRKKHVILSPKRAKGLV